MYAIGWLVILIFLFGLFWLWLFHKIKNKEIKEKDCCDLKTEDKVEVKENEGES